MKQILQLLKLPEPEALNDKKWIFLVGLLIYVVSQVAFSLYILNDRYVPYGTDDAYAYILKAPQMAEGCFQQKCPALADLKEQFSHHQTDPDKEWARYRASGRTSLVYHPFHSLIMWGLHDLGLGWEAAYNAILVVGAALLSLSVGFFLFQIWGGMAAGVALVLLSATQFTGQGLHFIVPSNLALCLAFFSWACLLKWREKAGYVVGILTILMLALHPVAKLYACISLVLLFLHDRRKFSCRALPSYLVTALPVLAAVILPYVINEPTLMFEVEPGTKGVFWAGLLKNIEHAYFIVSFWDFRDHLISQWIGRVMVCLGVYGLWVLPTARRKQVFIISLIFVGMAIASLALVLPRYPAEIFQRIWCIIAVIWMGGVGFAAIKLVTKAKSLSCCAKRLVNTGTVIVLLLTLGGSYYISGGALSIFERAKMMNVYDNGNFSEAQVDLAKRECGTVYYASEAALVYYLSHGALCCHSVFLAALDRPKDFVPTFEGKGQPALLAASKPSDDFTMLDDKRGATIQNNGSKPFQHVQILIKATAVGGRLVVRKEEQSFTKTLEDTDAAWIDLPFSVFAPNDKLWLEVTGVSAPVLLQGIRFDKDSAYQWPWGEKVSLFYKHYAEYTYNFDAESLSFGVFRNMKVLDETGSSLLAVGSFSDTP